jgi:hypothetical protein
MVAKRPQFQHKTARLKRLGRPMRLAGGGRENLPDSPACVRGFRGRGLGSRLMGGRVPHQSSINQSSINQSSTKRVGQTGRKQRENRR